MIRGSNLHFLVMSPRGMLLALVPLLAVPSRAVTPSRTGPALPQAVPAPHSPLGSLAVGYLVDLETAELGLHLFMNKRISSKNA